jgi:hypothetical protein
MPKTDDIRTDIPEPDQKPPSSITTEDDTTTQVETDATEEQQTDLEVSTDDSQNDVVVEHEVKVPMTLEELESMPMDEYAKWRNAGGGQSADADYFRGEQQAEQEARDEARQEEMTRLEEMAFDEYRKMVAKRDKDFDRLPGGEA